MGLPPSLAAAELWPIHAEGAIIRHNPAGDPDVEQHYHQALEDGRWLEQNVADANHWLIQKQMYWQHRIQTYLSINKLAVDGQFKLGPRKIKYIADSLSLLQSINQFQKEITGLTNALTSNLALLAQMEQNLQKMVQADLNALALLLNNICNWGLPSLPSIPNLLPDGIFNWNGFNFASLAQFSALISKLSSAASAAAGAINPATFSPNFSFSQCTMGLPALGNLAAAPPASVTSYSGNPFGTAQIIPPLNGTVPPAGQSLTDPAFIALMQQTTAVPVYGPAFNPNSSMIGAVPNPATIISDYQMPAQTYQNNIVSIVPSLTSNTVEPTDSDYNNPNLALRQPTLQKALVHFINLDAVVNSNFDPYITSAWLFYLSITRNGRGGNWLPQYQNAFATYIAPSIMSLANAAVPWNNVLGGSGVVDTPVDIPLVDTFKSLTAPALQTLYWELTYVEAGLLGYTRSKTWDAYQNGNYLSGVTGADLDYVPTVINTAVTSTITLGQGTAEFPVQCTFPTAITAVLNQVLVLATANIQTDTTYESPRLSNRFTYNQFAQATLVDRFTQFWRDFNSNMIAFLAQDPYLIQFAATYAGTLNGALNPLGDQTAYNSLQQDAATRNRAWTPGTPLLPIPVAPIVTYSNNTQPNSGNSGWQGIQFNTQAFLARPDIQGQPIPVQNAMLRTNLSYAGLLQSSAAQASAIQSQIANTTSLIQQVQQIGFEVVDDSAITVVPPVSGQPGQPFGMGNFGSGLFGPGSGNGTPVIFDTIVFDITGNVTNETTFTIQATGEYAYFGSINWLGTDTGGIRTVTVLQNNIAIFTQSTDPSFTAPITMQISGYGNFNEGDVVQVVASHTFATAENIGAGSTFSMIESGPTQPPLQVPPNTALATIFTADASMPTAPTAFFVQPDGGIAPVDPTIVRGHLQAAITNIQVNGNVLTVTCDNAFSTGATAFFYGLASATFLNGQSVIIASLIGAGPTYTGFTANFTNADYAGTDTGVANSGTVLFPFIDGITLEPTGGSPPSAVTCGTEYGSMYQIAEANFTVGALLYVGPGGVLTQDYATLVTEVQWIICAGRVMTTDTIIYEPSLPLRIVNLS